MGSAKTRTDITPRVIPSQRRAQETVELILDTAARMLEEVGADGLTTKELAARARIRVRSVYRYFPNKLAVIQAVAERVAERQKVVLQVATRRSSNDTPWRVALRRELNALVASFESEPGLGAVRKAMQASPALRQVDTSAKDVIAGLWANDLASRGMPGPPAHQLRVARTAVQIAAAILEDIRGSEGRERTAQLRELHRALEGYLAGYLDPPGRRREA